MWHKIINGHDVSFKRWQGISLIEILITLVIGTLILITIAKWFSDHHYNQTKQRELFSLQQHSHQLLDHFQHHIQHIGYQGEYRKGSNYDLFLFHGKSVQLASPQCITFFYDLNGDGCVGSRNKNQACHINGVHNAKEEGKEILGFKLKNNLLYFLNQKQKNCYQAECQKWVNACKGNEWKELSAANDYKIEKLSFEWEIIDKLLKIDLELSSVKLPDVRYQSTAYSYLFNSGE